MNNENTKLLINPKNVPKHEDCVNLDNSEMQLLINSKNDKYKGCVDLIYYDYMLLPTISPNYITPCKEKYLKIDNFLSEYTNDTQALMRVKKNLGIDGIALWGNIQGYLEDLHDLITYIKENSNKEIIYTWDNESSLSNMNNFIVEGVYHIKGERTRYDDNLPILNTGGGHTFSARLTVLDSSISDKNNNDDKCITLILAFNNRIGQGEVYIRTGKGASLDNLTWEKWSTLQRNVNVGEVGSLDDLKDNGIYSGVWKQGRINPISLAFVCIVINDYFIGIVPRKISQFVYGLSKSDGSIIYKTRVWDAMYDEWSEWEIINKAEIDKLIKIKFDEIIEVADPNAIDSIKNLVNWINTHGDTTESIINSIQGLEDNLTNLTYDVGIVSDNISYIKTTAARVDGNVFNSTADEVKLTTTGINTNEHYTVVLPTATVEKAGAMSASDKINLDNVPKKIDEAVVQEKQRAQQIENAIAKNGIKFEQTGIVVENGKLIFKKSSIDDSLNDLYVFPNVTTEHDGLMSTNDKIDLDANKSNIAIIDKTLKSELTRRLEVETDFYNTAVRYDKVGFIQYTNSLELYIRNLNDSETFYVDLPAATNKKAGVMTAEDKFKLDKLASKTVYLTEEEYKNLIETGKIQDDVEYNIYE